jgi:hypothetical protein
MMETILFLLLLSAIFTAEAQQNEDINSQGSFLTPTTKSSWQSGSGSTSVHKQQGLFRTIFGVISHNHTTFF